MSSLTLVRGYRHVATRNDIFSDNFRIADSLHACTVKLRILGMTLAICRCLQLSSTDQLTDCRG